MSWSLALTQPNREFAAARALARWEFDHHLFKIRRCIPFRGASIDRFYPAFPQYLFVSAHSAWDLLRQRCGIVRFICRELPSTTVPGLVAAAGRDDVLPIADLPSRRFHEGQRVLIRGMGLLAGHAAVFQNLVAENEAIVLVDWMGRWVPIAIDERDLVLEQNRKSSRRRQRGRRGRRGRASRAH